MYQSLRIRVCFGDVVGAILEWIFMQTACETREAEKFCLVGNDSDSNKTQVCVYLGRRSTKPIMLNKIILDPSACYVVMNPGAMHKC